MPIDKIILIASNIATLLTALIIFFTLIEMAKQRKLSSKPIIVTARQHIKAMADPNKLLKAPILWKGREFNVDVIDRFTLPLYNLGNSAATNITLRWSYPLNEFAYMINEMCKEKLIDISPKLSGYQAVSFIQDDEPIYAINLVFDLNDHCDYLLPASVNSSLLGARFPLSYISMISLYYQHYHLSRPLFSSTHDQVRYIL